MPFTGPLFKFALFKTGPDEFYWFTCCHHIITDGTGVALVGHRVASVYSAIVSGSPIPPAFFGSLKDLVSSELEYESSTDFSRIRPIGPGTFHRKVNRIIGCPRPRASVIRIRLLRRFNWTLRSFAEFTSCPTRGTCLDHR